MWQGWNVMPAIFFCLDPDTAKQSRQNVECRLDPGQMWGEQDPIIRAEQIGEDLYYSPKFPWDF